MSDESEFMEAYKSELADLKAPEKASINALTWLAQEHPQYAKSIILAVQERALTAAPEHKLAALYLFDSLVKNLRGDFLAAAETIVTKFIDTVYGCADDELRTRVRRLVGTWPDFFSTTTLGTIQGMLNADSRYAAPQQAPPVSSAPTSFPSATPAAAPTANLVSAAPPPADPRRHPIGRLVPNPNPAPASSTSSSVKPPDWLTSSAPPPSMAAQAPSQQPQWALPYAGGHSASMPPQRSAVLRPVQPVMAPPPLQPVVSQPSMTPQPSSAAVSVSPGEHRKRTLLQQLSAFAGSKNISAPNAGLLRKPDPSASRGGTKRPAASGAQQDFDFKRARIERNAEKYEPGTFSRDRLREPSHVLILRLYDDRLTRCKQCGLRFADSALMREHLDWHFVVNQRQKRKLTHARSRQWFLSLDEWALNDGSSKVAVAAPTPFLNAESGTNADADAQSAAASAAMSSAFVVADEAQTTCPVCGETFKEEWSNEEDDWIIRGCERRTEDNKIVHLTCT